MQTPEFVDGQFVDGTLLNGAVAQLMADFGLIGSGLHTSGLLQPGYLAFSSSGLVLTVQAPAPFGVLFGSGMVVNAYGTVSGASTTTYTVNLSSFVPGSGSVRVYILAQLAEIGQQPTQVIGPPVGHPDYDPNFSPFLFYLEQLDSLAIVASTSGPDNVTTFELGRLTLLSGMVTLPAVDTTHWRYASAVLNPTGVVPGTYPGATVEVGVDGRVTSIGSVLYGPLAGTNVWTGTNTFNNPITAVDPNAQGGLVVTGVSGAAIRLAGNGATTPNKFIRAFNGVLDFVNSAYSAVAMSLSDAGVLTVASGVVATVGNIIASAGAMTAKGNVTSTNGAVVGQTGVTANTGNVTASAGSVIGQTGVTANTGNVTASAGSVIGQTGVAANTGDVVASNGKLRALHGAYLSGDSTIATLLGDFGNIRQGNDAYIFERLPDGFIIQAFHGLTVTGDDSIAFPNAFPNACSQVWAGESNPIAGWPTLPTIFGTESYSPGGFQLYCAKWTGSAWGWGPSVGFRYIAIGY